MIVCNLNVGLYTMNWSDAFINSFANSCFSLLFSDIYVYEDKKIKVKFKYDDEYNYLIQYIKRRKGDIL